MFPKDAMTRVSTSLVALLISIVASTGCGGGSSTGPVTPRPQQAPFPTITATTTIDVYGDSTTAGWDGATRDYIAQTAPKVMADITGAKVINYGRSGAMADHVEPEWPRLMEESKASIVIINYGLNDANHCDEDHFEWLLRPLVTKTPASKHVVLQTPNYAAAVADVTPKREACVRKFAEVTRKVAALYGLRLIDIYALTEPLVKADPALLPDGIHPTAALYKQIGQEMTRVLTAK